LNMEDRPEMSAPVIAPWAPSSPWNVIYQDLKQWRQSQSDRLQYGKKPHCCSSPPRTWRGSGLRQLNLLFEVSLLRQSNLTFTDEHFSTLSFIANIYRFSPKPTHSLEGLWIPHFWKPLHLLDGGKMDLGNCLTPQLVSPISFRNWRSRMLFS
jgi:hypothetical protein